ncbi:hypothetical protein PG993_005704 [Apiospora rasikravindrae]|uniref:Serine hydrolase domain-containing protein n=1 Tax=Apiospora rasikravindrae TaxID=990691 RepID=A0ABR1T9J0_9PEZI
MSDNNNNNAAAAAPPSTAKPAKNNGKKAAKPAPPPKRDLKILMLHGYTQSGALFKGRTGALNKVLNRALGEMPAATRTTAPPTDNWGWFQHDEGTGAYRGFDNGMQRIAESIREAGGVDGVMGFSQGAAFAAMVASAMEESRTLPADEKLSNWATQLRSANNNKPLKFCIVYSGFVGRDPALQWLYEGGFATPSLHVYGGLDTVVSEDRTRGLWEKCTPTEKGGKAQVLVHPGGHFVPVKKEWTTPIAGWLMEVLKGETLEPAAAEEKA